MIRSIRHAAIASASLAAAVTLTACGGSVTTTSGQNIPGRTGMQGMTPSTPATPPADAATAHNAADTSFATNMIPHHQQAITMAQMAQKQASNAQVKTLAAAIQSAQDPEIATMSGWLTAWGQPFPLTSGGHDIPSMGNAPMEGIMSEAEMAQLSATSGVASTGCGCR